MSLARFAARMLRIRLRLLRVRHRLRLRCGRKNSKHGHISCYHRLSIKGRTRAICRRVPCLKNITRPHRISRHRLTSYTAIRNRFIFLYFHIVLIRTVYKRNRANYTLGQYVVRIMPCTYVSILVIIQIIMHGLAFNLASLSRYKFAAIITREILGVIDRRYNTVLFKTLHCHNRMPATFLRNFNRTHIAFTQLNIDYTQFLVIKRSGTRIIFSAQKFILP